jgi:hypothetical protein
MVEALVCQLEQKSWNRVDLVEQSLTWVASIDKNIPHPIHIPQLSIQL